nr:coiled-coil domain-containing protein 18-like [Pseudochaenichthys georgianus]
MEMNNRDELAAKLEILQKENQEMKLLLEQERTLRDKLEIEGAKNKEAMLNAYTEKSALLFKHNVNVKAQVIEQNILRFNNEDLNVKYGNLQRSHKKVEAKMAALRKAIQELKQLKEPCVEEQGVEMAALLKENKTLKQEKERCVEEKDAKMAALQKTNQELKQLKERCVEEEAVKIAALRERNQEITQLKERCVKEEANMAALQTTNQELKQQTCVALRRKMQR